MTRTTRRNDTPLGLALFALALLLLLVFPRATRSQTTLSGTWTGRTSHDQRITITVENNVVTLVSVGIHSQNGPCSSRYTAIHHGNLGFIHGNHFVIAIENDQEILYLEGDLVVVPVTMGEHTLYRAEMSGYLGFQNKTISYVCPGHAEATWWSTADIPRPWNPPLAAPVGQPPTAGIWPVQPTATTWTRPTATPTHKVELDWDGIPAWEQPDNGDDGNNNDNGNNDAPTATGTATRTPTRTSTPSPYP